MKSGTIQTMYYTCTMYMTHVNSCTCISLARLRILYTTFIVVYFACKCCGKIKNIMVCRQICICSPYSFTHRLENIEDGRQAILCWPQCICIIHIFMLYVLLYLYYISNYLLTNKQHTATYKIYIGLNNKYKLAT